jgi:glycosyltransferase involved in cell wall biosynthesis
LNVVSWQPVLTDHQSYTLAALRAVGNCDLTVYVARLEHAERQAQGWVNRHVSSLSPELIPTMGWLRFVFRRLRMHRDAAHLFGSPFEQPRLILALLLAAFMGRRVYLISEPYSPVAAGYLNDKRPFINRIKAGLRPLLYGVYGALLRRRIAGVFAISRLAVEQYRNMGVADEKIFPFGYFVPGQHLACAGSFTGASPEKSGLNIVFIGNLIARKGLDVLLNAVEKLHAEGLEVSLDIYGPGEPAGYDFARAAAQYCGTIPFGYAQSVIAHYDVLVLPSRYDGWGVVVNEALIAGVPVICSNRVGAGAVVEKWRCGAVFLSEDASDLADKLAVLEMNPMLLNDMRQAACEVGALLDPAIAGRYMADTIRVAAADRARTNHRCPWYDCE